MISVCLSRVSAMKMPPSWPPGSCSLTWMNRPDSTCLKAPDRIAIWMMSELASSTRSRIFLFVHGSRNWLTSRQATVSIADRVSTGLASTEREPPAASMMATSESAFIVFRMRITATSSANGRMTTTIDGVRNSASLSTVAEVWPESTSRFTRLST